MRSAWSATFSRASSILLAGSAGVRGSSLPGASCFLPRSSTVDRSLALRMLDASWSICRTHRQGQIWASSLSQLVLSSHRDSTLS